MMQNIAADRRLKAALFNVIVEYGRNTGHGTDDTFVAVDRVLSVIRKFYDYDDGDVDADA